MEGFRKTPQELVALFNEKVTSISQIQTRHTAETDKLKVHIQKLADENERLCKALPGNLEETFTAQNGRIKRLSDAVRRLAQEHGEKATDLKQAQAELKAAQMTIESTKRELEETKTGFGEAEADISRKDSTIRLQKRALIGAAFLLIGGASYFMYQSRLQSGKCAQAISDLIFQRDEAMGNWQTCLRSLDIFTNLYSP